MFLAVNVFTISILTLTPWRRSLGYLDKISRFRLPRPLISQMILPRQKAAAARLISLIIPKKQTEYPNLKISRLRSCLLESGQAIGYTVVICIRQIHSLAG